MSEWSLAQAWERGADDCLRVPRPGMAALLGETRVMNDSPTIERDSRLAFDALPTKTPPKTSSSLLPKDEQSPKRPPAESAETPSKPRQMISPVSGLPLDAPSLASPPSKANDDAPSGGDGPADGTTVDVLIAIEQMIEKAKEVLAEEEFAIEAGLSPIKQVRLRRKSRDLEEEGTKLMSENLEKAFLAMDLNGDGKLDATELKAAFASAGRACTDSMIKIAIKNLDTDDDNEVSFEEFKAIAWHLATHQNQ